MSKSLWGGNIRIFDIGDINTGPGRSSGGNHLNKQSAANMFIRVAYCSPTIPKPQIRDVVAEAWSKSSSYLLFTIFGFSDTHVAITACYLSGNITRMVRLIIVEVIHVSSSGFKTFMMRIPRVPDICDERCENGNCLRGGFFEFFDAAFYIPASLSLGGVSVQNPCHTFFRTPFFICRDSQDM